MKNVLKFAACSFLSWKDQCATETVGIILSYKKKKDKVVVLFWDDDKKDYKKAKVPVSKIMMTYSEKKILEIEMRWHTLSRMGDMTRVYEIVKHLCRS